MKGPVLDAAADTTAETKLQSVVAGPEAQEHAFNSIKQTIERGETDMYIPQAGSSGMMRLVPIADAIDYFAMERLIAPEQAAALRADNIQLLSEIGETTEQIRRRIATNPESSSVRVALGKAHKELLNELGRARRAGGHFVCSEMHDWPMGRISATGELEFGSILENIFWARRAGKLGDADAISLAERCIKDMVEVGEMTADYILSLYKENFVSTAEAYNLIQGCDKNGDLALCSEKELSSLYDAATAEGLMEPFDFEKTDPNIDTTRLREALETHDDKITTGKFRVPRTRMSMRGRLVIAAGLTLAAAVGGWLAIRSSTQDRASAVVASGPTSAVAETAGSSPRPGAPATAHPAREPEITKTTTPPPMAPKAAPVEAAPKPAEKMPAQEKAAAAAPTEQPPAPEKAPTPGIPVIYTRTPNGKMRVDEKALLQECGSRGIKVERKISPMGKLSLVLSKDGKSVTVPGENPQAVEGKNTIEF